MKRRLQATNQLGGVQARKRGGGWIDAPAVESAFVVNIGDRPMRRTNDIAVSTPHRVFNRSARERSSVAFLFEPNPAALAAAIPSCVGPGDLSKFRLDASKPADLWAVRATQAARLII